MSEESSPQSLLERLNKPVTDELIMKITKEVVVKFIEAGRLSPVKFEETFGEIHRVVKATARAE
jgi:hypothetical protein